MLEERKLDPGNFRLSNTYGNILYGIGRDRMGKIFEIERYCLFLKVVHLWFVVFVLTDRKCGLWEKNI